MADRYSRQILYFGEKNQEKLSKATVCVVGCGALGSAAASMLARAGVSLKLIDTDVIEESNLHRTDLFEEGDIGKNKAEVAKKRLEKINSSIRIESRSEEVTSDNVSIISADIVVDCTDNIRTRHLINEFCIKNKIPWIYGAVVGLQGMSAVFHGRPCFRCMVSKDIQEDQLETPNTHGVLSPACRMISSWQVLQVIKILTGKSEFGTLLSFSLESQEFSFSKIKPDTSCNVCAK
ncbi:MAG: HesA/MoeB/ThiF family protein [Candidatus Aenigmatarchaeota archaeon]